MTRLTLILPYYENPGMLREHQRYWRLLPPSVTAALDVIVVDDCSPGRPARPHVDSPAVASFRLYRTLIDRRWNWLFARNLGVQEAQTSWVLLTDIDHVAPEQTLVRLMTGPLEPDVVYRFSRVDAPHLTPYKPHPNSWFLTREMFDKIGGYDERFSGYYGTDADFRERVLRTARAVVMLPEALIRYPREHIPDASTTTYGRKEEQDHINVARIRADRSRITNWRPLRVTFPYERLI